MRFFLRSTGILVLLALLVSPVPLLAQEESAEITVTGSGIVEPAFRALAEASGAEAPLNITVTGTNTGFSRFCAGEADITLANRSITSAEDNICTTNEVSYVDLLFGHDILALIAHPEADYAVCLDTEHLNTIFAPSVQGQVANWNQVLEEGPDLALALYLPGENSPTYAILDSQVEGDGLRLDVTTSPTAAEIISAVSATNGALGVVRLPEALEAGDAITIIDLDAGNLPGCHSPTAENVEDNLYPAANVLLAYVNVASLDQPALADLLTGMIGEEASTVIEEAGFVNPTGFALEANQQRLAAGIAGQPIPRAADDFNIPGGLVGQVSVGGAAAGFSYMQDITGSFGALNPGITLDLSIEGEPAGFRRLCNGEIDLALAYRDLNADESANCAANEIETLTLPLGQQAVVLLANAGTDFLACLTTQEITATWSAQAHNTVTTWNQVNPAFAEVPITLFAPSLGSVDTDLMLIKASNSPVASRADTQQNDDPLYLAAATANVEGGLAHMNWFDYQQVLANNQAAVTLVGVDGGAGCVVPTPQTIADGSYPLAQPVQLIINRAELARSEVQALLWSILSSENYTLLESNRFIGVRFGDLPNLRATLQSAFDEAEAQAAAEAAIEAEATVEAEETVEPASEAEVTEEAATEEASE